MCQRQFFKKGNNFPHRWEQRVGQLQSGGVWEWLHGQLKRVYFILFRMSEIPI